MTPTRSAPSSSVMSGPEPASAATCCAYWSAFSPWTASTVVSLSAASAAATSSCVASGLAAQIATFAPPARSVRTSTAVSAVTCRHAATETPSSGRSVAKRARIDRRTGICPSAQPIRASPSGARAGSAMTEPAMAIPWV